MMGVRCPRPGRSLRVRGRHPRGGSRTQADGSSPRVRGRSASTSRAVVSFAEDPRACAGDRHPSRVSGMPRGGSPRVRGRLRSLRHPQHRARRIPACAGPTLDLLPDGRLVGEDPRVRGADPTASRYGSTCGGRSPRARGRRARASGGGGGGRKIPACAGPTVRFGPVRAPRSEDPRVRGADDHCYAMTLAKRGRSPRARGRREDGGPEPGHHRKIPACAGPTRRRRRRSGPRPEDPRVRGADALSSASESQVVGRSPRARGRHGRRRSTPPVRRKIPACAGPTPLGWSGGRGLEEDPRVRGADGRRTHPADSGRGRSPRARGRRTVRGRRWCMRRKIPACAGPTPAELRSYRPVCQFSFSCFPIGCRDRDQDSRPTLTRVRAP